ncbi:MAG: N-acetylmuramoyl-L-alanine amidase [Chloroflexi bacterium]|nr:N-acetylmuramoyl-L-alanine amidase [Chloroflexota bacterium]
MASQYLTRRRVLQAGVLVGAGLALPSSRGVLAAPEGFDADVGLDPGHSRADVGASGGGFGEYQHTLDIAERIRPMLEAAGLSVRLSRTDHEPLTAMSHRDINVRTEIEQSARIAAVGTVRIYVSIHFNGGPPSLRGTETYYNSESAGPDSRRLALALQRSVVAELAEVGYQTADRGAKEDLAAGKPYGHFFSLRGPMPSALVEGLFLSNPAEAELLLREDARQALAKGYVGGIVAYFAGG